MAKKKILQDNEGQIWPITVADCVYLVDGSKTVKKYIDDALANKSDSAHDHKYAGSSSVGGAATSANKVNQNLIVKLNGGTTEDTNLFTFNGSTEKTIDITPSNIGAAPSTSKATLDNSKTANVTYAYDSNDTTVYDNLITLANDSATRLDTDNFTRHITPESIKAAEEEHAHNYAASESEGGNAMCSDMVTMSDLYDSAISQIACVHSGVDGPNVLFYNSGVTIGSSGYISAAGFGGNATSASKLQSAKTFTIGSASKSFDGSENVSWTLEEAGIAPATHNHTSLTGITSLDFAVEGTDTFSISSVIDGTTSYMDFNMSDDVGSDTWRWRFTGWDADTDALADTVNLMTLKATSNTAGELRVTGEVKADILSGADIYGSTITLSGNSKSLVAGTGGGDVYISNSASNKYLQLKDDGTLSYSNSVILHADNYTNYAASASHNHRALTVTEPGAITSTSADTTSNWGAQNVSVHWYSTTGQLTDQPNQWGLVLNMGRYSEVHQIWCTQASGSLYHRGGNGGGWSGTWREVLDSSNYTNYAVPKTGGTVSGELICSSNIRVNGKRLYITADAPGTKSTGDIWIDI